jgi:DNA-binding cell septation regulator SpoVG
MRITEIEVRLQDHRATQRLQAYAGVTFDDRLVVRGIKIIHLGGSRMLVAMPETRLGSACRACGHQVPYVHRFCGHCGTKAASNRHIPICYKTGRPDLYRSVAFPATPEYRAELETAILRAYRRAEAEAQSAKEQEVYKWQEAI